MRPAAYLESVSITRCAPEPVSDEHRQCLARQRPGCPSCVKCIYVPMAAQRREQDAIFGLQSRPRMLATQHCKLVAQRQDFDFVGLSRSAAKHDQLKDAAQRQVDQRPDHRHLAQEGELAATHRSPAQGQIRWSPTPSTSGGPRHSDTPAHHDAAIPSGGDSGHPFAAAGRGCGQERYGRCQRRGEVVPESSPPRSSRSSCPARPRRRSGCRTACW